MVRWGGVWWTYFFWSETNLLANTAVMVVWGGILVTYWILSVSWWGQGEQTGGMGQEKIVGNNIKKIMLNITISSIQMQNNIDLNMVLSKIYYQKNDSVSKFLFFLASFQSKKYFRFSVSCSELFELRCYSKSAFKLALFALLLYWFELQTFYLSYLVNYAW